MAASSIFILARPPGTGRISNPTVENPTPANRAWAARIRAAQRLAELEASQAESRARIEALVARANAPWVPSRPPAIDEARAARAERWELQRLADARRRQSRQPAVSVAPARRLAPVGPVLRYRVGDVTPAGDVVREVRADGALVYGRASHLRQWTTSTRPVVRLAKAARAW